MYIHAQIHTYINTYTHSYHIYSQQGKTVSLHKEKSFVHHHMFAEFLHRSPGEKNAYGEYKQ